jgi:16S rRNA (adenine1518-N6/adenine1519-N6)-dimethyltransferase
VVHLTPRADLPGKPAIGSLERITAAAFGQRRKMLRSSLKSLGGDPLPLLEAAAIDPTARAEDVSVADFARLATVWEDRC